MNIRKKIITFLTIIVILCLCAFTISCSQSAYFEQDEYFVRSGDKVSVQGRATVTLLGEIPDGVIVSSDGVFTVTEFAANNTQVLLGLVVNGKIVDTAICTIYVDTATPQITIDNLSDYVIDGEIITAVSVPKYSINYSLKTQSVGISIDQVTGKVSFTDKVLEGQKFTVVASAKNVSVEREFSAAVQNLVYASNDTLFAEFGGENDVSVVLKFPEGDTDSYGVLGVRYGKEKLTEDDYSYNPDTQTLTLKRTILSRLKEGENDVSVATEKNTVKLTIKNARFIATAEELAEIGRTKEALSGYYVQVSDIDLKSYLSATNEGWYPIGVYKDVTDGTATKMAFNGTYDGNGHTISNFYINRTGEVAFNSGLFGYATTNATIENINLVCDEDKTHSVRSYSGALIGVNCGIIRNCAVYANVVAEECKTVGIFVGRNEGSVYNSYALGSAIGGEKVGAFCGENQGKIVNCYAATGEALGFCGIGGKGEKVYVTELELFENADFSTWDGWIISEDGKPILKSVEVDYSLRSIKVLNQRTEYIKGMTFNLVVITNPSYIEGLSLEYALTEGEGVTVSADGTVDLTNANNGEYTITISCGKISTYYSFTVSDSVEDIVTVYTVEDFIAFKGDTNNYSKLVILMADLDFEGSEITSVGYYYEDGNVVNDGIFTGTFDGNGHTIKNVKIIRNAYDKTTENGNYDDYQYHPAYYNVGLFCYVTGTVKNLTLENLDVTPTYQGEGTGNYVGIVCGTLFGVVENCEIKNCTYYGKDDQSLNTGTICGVNYGSVVNVKVDGENYGEQ